MPKASTRRSVGRIIVRWPIRDISVIDRPITRLPQTPSRGSRRHALIADEPTRAVDPRRRSQFSIPVASARSPRPRFTNDNAHYYNKARSSEAGRLYARAVAELTPQNPRRS